MFVVASIDSLWCILLWNLKEQSCIFTLKVVVEIAGFDANTICKGSKWI